MTEPEGQSALFSPWEQEELGKSPSAWSDWRHKQGIFKKKEQSCSYTQPSFEKSAYFFFRLHLFAVWGHLFDLLCQHDTGTCCAASPVFTFSKTLPQQHLPAGPTSEPKHKQRQTTRLCLHATLLTFRSCFSLKQMLLQETDNFNAKTKNMFFTFQIASLYIYSKDIIRPCRHAWYLSCNISICWINIFFLDIFPRFFKFHHLNQSDKKWRSTHICLLLLDFF